MFACRVLCFCFSGRSRDTGSSYNEIFGAAPWVGQVHSHLRNLIRNLDMDSAVGPGCG
jgi:hypothetical protein